MTDHRNTLLVILDRDGVINKDSTLYITHPDNWEPIEGSIEAIAKLTKAGYQVAVATNQSGVGRGYFTQRDLDDMHSKMKNLVTQAGGNIQYIAFCPHLPDEGCRCRKPDSGMLETIADQLGLDDLGKAWMVGDSLKDLQAASKAGCRPVLVRTGNGVTTIKEIEGTPLETTPVFDNLLAFVETLLSGKLTP